MTQTVFLALLIVLVFAFFCEAPQSRMREAFRHHPGGIWLAPIALTALFTAAAWVCGAASLALTVSMLVYTAAPTLCASLWGPATDRGPGWLDFLAILLIWLPLEFAAGAGLVPRSAQGFLHSVAYGVAILLGLTIFLCFRSFGGMKYNPPRGWLDLWRPLAGYLLTAPVLVAVGIPIGFIPPPHLPTAGAARMAAAAGLIFAGTALPEEILFRSLIQNLVMQRWGTNGRTLFAAALIFGAAHLDNGPQPLPNWRYMILATIAGIAYGKVFQKSATVGSSAVLHMLVDWTKHFFF